LLKTRQRPRPTRRANHIRYWQSQACRRCFAAELQLSKHTKHDAQSSLITTRYGFSFSDLQRGFDKECEGSQATPNLNRRGRHLESNREQGSFGSASLIEVPALRTGFRY